MHDGSHAYYDDEQDRIARRVEKPRAGHRYKIELRGNTLTIHESGADLGWRERFALPFSQREHEAIAERFAHFQPVLRFILVDTERRLFAPERFCLRGSVDDWISSGRTESVERIPSKYLKHLGQESMYELF